MEPFYILHSRSNKPPSHPLTIQYHYADDPPLALVPQTADEHVILLDYDKDETVPVATSLSEKDIVVDIKVTTAPGAGEFKRNEQMYIVHTAPLLPTEKKLSSAKEILSQFKSQNEMLRRALMYPANPAASLSASPP